MTATFFRAWNNFSTPVDAKCAKEFRFQMTANTTCWIHTLALWFPVRNSYSITQKPPPETRVADTVHDLADGQNHWAMK